MMRELSSCGPRGYPTGGNIERIREVPVGSPRRNKDVLKREESSSYKSDYRLRVSVTTVAATGLIATFIRKATN
jgi:hypothetical protein